MKRSTLGGIFSAATLLGGLAVMNITAPVAATAPDPPPACPADATSNDMLVDGEFAEACVEPKVWICHVVEGEGETKSGYNLIEVAQSAVDGDGQNDHTHHVARDGRRDLIPAPVDGNGVAYCPAPEPIDVTPTIVAPTCSTSGTVVEQAGVIWTIDPNGEFATATAADGYRIVGPQVFDLRPLDGDDGCPGPAPKVTVSPWVDDEIRCETEHVVQYRTVVTTPYVWDSEAQAWVLDPSEATRTVESRTRPITDDEIDRCEGVEETSLTLPTVVAPTCDADGYVVLPGSTLGYEWILRTDGTYEAVLDEGHVFPDGTVTTFDPGDLDRLVGDQCQASNPPPGVIEQPAPPPPTTTPTVADAGGTAQLPVT